MKKVLLPLLISSFSFFFFVTIISSFHNTYTIASTAYQEAYHMHQDCFLPQFKTRFPTICAHTHINPPRSFLYMWCKYALQDVSVCGPIPCSELLTYNSFIIVSCICIIYKFFL